MCEESRREHQKPALSDLKENMDNLVTDWFREERPEGRYEKPLKSFKSHTKLGEWSLTKELSLADFF